MANSPGDEEQIPLGWVRKWMVKRAQNICAVIDRIPANLKTETHWQMARQEARAMVSDFSELQKLAAWLEVPAQSKKRGEGAESGRRCIGKNGKKSAISAPSHRDDITGTKCGRKRTLPRGSRYRDKTNGN